MRSIREPEPEFFIDRSLGKSFADGLRAVGLTVHTGFGLRRGAGAETPGRSLAPRRRRKRLGRAHKDDAIRRRPAGRDALTEAGVRVFCLTSAQLRGAEQTARFVENRHRIIRQARTAGPYIYGVYAKRIARLWP